MTTPKSTTKNSRKNAQETQKTNWFLFLQVLSFLYIFVANSAFGYSGGDGSRENPYQIADVNNLLQLAADANNYRKFFILTADINLAGYDFNDAVIAPGNEYSPAFYGSFDGACHKISNLTINAGENAYYLGLFGHTALDVIDINSEGEYYWSEIKNLTLENVNINRDQNGATIGNLVGYNYGVPITNCHSTGIINYTSLLKYANFVSGGLVGVNFGNISNCSSEGTIFITSNLYAHGLLDTGGLVGIHDDTIITDSHSDCTIICNISSDDYFGGGFVRVGGLVGGNDGASQNSFINNCYSTGVVSVNNLRCHITIGGLAGENSRQIYQAYINKCFSTSPVTVTGDANNKMGGLVGVNYGYCTISDCYSTGPVTGPAPASGDGIGGLVGCNASYANIINCYSVGEVNASVGYANIGGLVGTADDENDINSCYFLNTKGPANGLGTPLSDTQMKQQASFVVWDFVGETINGTEDIWWLLENIAYPKLNWQRKLPSNPCGPAGPNDGGIYFPDYDFDNFVNFLDFAIFADAWLIENPFISLDSDNDVDIYDLKIFCDLWLTYTDKF